MCETDDRFYENDNDTNQITTKEILRIYENVAEVDEQITTEEILKMYETESESESGERETDCVQKTTRKRKKRIFHGK